MKNGSQTIIDPLTTASCRSGRSSTEGQLNTKEWWKLKLAGICGSFNVNNVRNIKLTCDMKPLNRTKKNSHSVLYLSFGFQALYVTQ
jgi:hypothetical protein